MTRYQLLVSDWKDCRRCHLSTGRLKVVMARGSLPCDVLFTGEAPGECITGDTLIETAFRDKSIYPDGIPIKELVGKTGVKVYSYDTDSKKLVLGTVKKVWLTGVKKVYRVSYFWWGAPPDGKGGRQKYFGSIKVTDNHPFLLKSGEYRSVRQGLTPGNRLQPFYRHGKDRYHFVGTYSGSMKKESLLLMENKLGRPLDRGEQVRHDDRNKLNDGYENLILMDVAEHARLHGYEDNAMFNDVHRETHRRVMRSEEYRENHRRVMKRLFEDPEVRRKRSEQNRRVRDKTSESVKAKYKDPEFYLRYLKARRMVNGRKLSQEEVREKFLKKFPDHPYPPEDNHEVISVEDAGIEAVYDMEVEKYHNFAANGIFVHNSENVVGRPFIGPAGDLLDHVISRSIPAGVSYAVMNTVGCIPRLGDGKKAAEPDDEAVEACRPRTEELFRIAAPRLLVAVGAFAWGWLEKGYKHTLKSPEGTTVVRIDHPAFVLRSNLAARGLMIQKMVVTVRNAVEDLNLRGADDAGTGA